MFFEKLAEYSATSVSKSALTSANPVINQKPMSLEKSNRPIPETRQFMDYNSGGDLQKTVVQNPIQRSPDNVGRPQPVFPNQSF